MSRERYASAARKWEQKGQDHQQMSRLERINCPERITVFSDHSALTTLTRKELVKIPNQYIVNMLEKLAPFNFEVKNLPGSQNKVADFLSHHPQQTQETSEFPRQGPSVLVCSVKSVVSRREGASF